jgi:hypothetical protein
MRPYIFVLLTLFLTRPILSQDFAQDFSVKDIYGNTHKLYADYLDKDKYVFVEFFYVNCQPCRDQTPRINTVFKEFGCNDGELVFLGLENLTDNASVLAFTNNYEMEFPAVSGSEGGGTEVYDAYGYWYTPYKILINPSGEIIADDPPINSADDLRDSLLNMGFKQQSCKGNDFIFYALISETDSASALIDPLKKEVMVELPEGTDLSDLRTTFVNSPNSVVTIDGTEQISGESRVDLSSGELICRITSEEGITENWTVRVSLTASRLHSEHDIKLYPNPVKDILYIETSRHSNAAFEIWDISGKPFLTGILRSDKTTADLSKLPAGMYLIKIVSGDQYLVKTFIKGR